MFSLFGPIASARADLLTAFAMLALWSLLGIFLMWGHWGPDLGALYMAGYFFHNGQYDLIYAAPPSFFGGPAAQWLPSLESLGLGGEETFAYIYPPLWAALAAPATAVLSPQAFGNLIYLLQVPLLGASALLAAKLGRPAGLSYAAAAAISLVLSLLLIPGKVALWHNQPTIAMIFLIILSFERLQANRPVAAGLALALAVALKLTPAVFLLVWLLDRQWRACFAFIIAVLVFALCSLLLAGIDLHLSFVAATARASEFTLLTRVNMSALAALIFAGSALGVSASIPMDVETIILPAPAGLLGQLPGLALAFILLFTAWRIAPLPAPQRRLTGLIAVSLALPLFGPLGWAHYYLLPVLLVPGFVSLFPTARYVLVLVVCLTPMLPWLFSMETSLPWVTAPHVWLHVACWVALLAFVLAPQPRKHGL
jgi:alpha-1,2-mannosyltransferase